MEKAIGQPSKKEAKRKARRLNKFAARSLIAVGIVSSQGDGIRSCKYDDEACSKANLQFKTSQLLVHDVEGCRTRSMHVL